MRISIIVALLCMSSSVMAQSIQPPPDRKDYIISTMQAQRNDAMDREAVCRSDSVSAMDALRKEIADLKEKLAAAEKK